MVGPSLHTHNLTLKPNAAAATIKFLCSYGGKILPRYPDGKLRYQGGETRVLAVERSISFAELLVKLGQLCGTSVSLRCQLPTEDLDALVSITSDEDLANLIEEYDRAASLPSALKIRAFLSPPKSTKKVSPPPSTAASSNLQAASPPRSFYSVGSSSRYPDRCIHQITKPVEEEILWHLRRTTIRLINARAMVMVLPIPKQNTADGNDVGVIGGGRFLGSNE